MYLQNKGKASFTKTSYSKETQEDTRSWKDILLLWIRTDLVLSK